jgi:molecular chaperone DnaJ
MSQKRCYYEVLGVPRESPPEEIRRAYKREALKHHPDRNQGDCEAEGKFKAANEAYQVLSDEEKRSVYDRFGHAGLEGGGMGGGGGIGDVLSHMQDLFSEMFSGGGFGFGGRAQRRGGDLRVQERISFVSAAFGCKREVNVQAPARCDDCGGAGAAKGTRPEPCGPCGGTGQVSNARGFVMFTAPCAKCGGRGVFIKTPCKTCSGHGLVEKTRTVTVAFPAGIDAGQRLRVPGQGMPGPNGAGDLYVDVDIEEDPRFERDGVDVVTRVHIPFTLAALGGKVTVPVLEPDPSASESIQIAAGTQGGQVVTLKGRGVPRLDGRGRGCLVVEVRVDVPTKLSARAKELLAELQGELEGLNVRVADEEAVSRKVATK